MARRRHPCQLSRVGRTGEVCRSGRRFLDGGRVARGPRTVHRLRRPSWFRVPQATVGGDGLAGENCLMAYQVGGRGWFGSRNESLTWLTFEADRAGNITAA